MSKTFLTKKKKKIPVNVVRMTELSCRKRCTDVILNLN